MKQAELSSFYRRGCRRGDLGTWFPQGVAGAGDQGKALTLGLANSPMGASGLPRSLFKATLGEK